MHPSSTRLIFTCLTLLVLLFSSCGKKSSETLQQVPEVTYKPSPAPRSLLKYHTLTLSFEGPQSSEQAKDNPFLNYRLTVEFIHKETKKTIRGFYAADGNAAETSASKGNIWQARFTPELLGQWTYKAYLHQGEKIALSSDLTLGESLPIENAEGGFIVLPSGRKAPDFRGKGFLITMNGYYKFRNRNEYFLKVGANSPENFLAFQDFDNAYRIQAEAREGEAAATGEIHTYAPHVQDWKPGDPTWQGDKGKGIIGAVNYLASKDMNTVYFLTFNIQGDGKDVRMYAQPDDFTRFDVSKTAQWELVFQHMQSQGIALHLVTQETENETLLDEGNTGELRQLYYLELIARFGHHPGLIWNLGEENGVNTWTPVGQNDDQRKAMAAFFRQNDPYQHPVIIHTQPFDPIRADVLNPLLGNPDFAGISLQQDKREEVPQVIRDLKERAKTAGHDWVISMDEIGMWHTGALTDTADVDHHSLTRYALWGSLLSGAAGVEWYFGGRHVHNDLSSEDWRQRDRLWEITENAQHFFQEYLPYHEMEPTPGLIAPDAGYCFRKKGEVYVLYLFAEGKNQIDVSEAEGEFEVDWYDPWGSGELQKGTLKKITGGGIREVGNLPDLSKQDLVVLLRKEGFTLREEHKEEHGHGHIH